MCSNIKLIDGGYYCKFLGEDVDVTKCNEEECEFYDFAS